MKIIKTLLFGIVMISFIACEKQPIADFRTDDSEYTAGDVVILTNLSTDASKYKWTMPDGETQTSKDASYKINENNKDGIITFKLEVFSESGNKRDEAYKNVKVKAATGNVTFWYNSFGTTATVEINDKVGYITKWFTTYDPDCGSDGCANFTLPIGNYNYNAFSSYHTWHGSVTVLKNGCSRICLL